MAEPIKPASHQYATVKEGEQFSKEIVLKKVSLCGNLKVGRNTITFELPNPKGLTLEQVATQAEDPDFCGGCHGILTAIGTFLY